MNPGLWALSNYSNITLILWMWTLIFWLLIVKPWGFFLKFPPAEHIGWIKREKHVSLQIRDYYTQNQANTSIQFCAWKHIVDEICQSRLARLKQPLYTTIVSRKASQNAQHAEPWGAWTTTVEDYIRCHSYQLRTGVRGFSGHRSPKVDSWRLEKHCIIFLSSYTRFGNGTDWALGWFCHAFLATWQPTFTHCTWLHLK